MNFAKRRHGLILALPIFTVLMNLNSPYVTALEPQGWETPASYTLTQAMDRAFAQSFGSRVEYERQIQAHLTARAAYLNLLPHLSISSVLASASASATGLLGVIGDLAPFLLPTRWLQARDAALMSVAERQALALMRADSAAQVEGLSCALERDNDILKGYQSFSALALKTRDALSPLEDRHEMPDGSTDHLNAVLNSMTLDLLGVGESVHEDKIALSQAMGFVSPDAVSDLVMDGEDLPINLAKPLDTEPTTQAALHVSYELAQLDQLILVAQHQRTELYFNWLDPAGDYTAALGFGLGTTIAVGRSRIRELQVSREQLVSSISRKIAEAVMQYNESLTAYKTAQDGIELQSRRLTRVLAQIEPGSQLNTLDVQGIFQDALTSLVRFEAIVASFRVARSLIDRALLQGRYAGLVNPASRLR